MLALAGYPLGIRCTFLDRSADSPGAQVAPSLLGPLEDAALLEQLAERSDVLTFDWENISGKALAPLAKLTAIRPPRAALEVSQDRLHEKALFRRLKIPVAEHAAVDTPEDLARAVTKLGTPGILKTRRLGYDGKGQCRIERRADLDAAWALIGGEGLIYEKLQRFSARTYMKRVMSALGYIGVLAIEFFVVQGRLVANEMAPRVHNSGHWTIEGCVTSQFENHLRAICGLPLGSTRPLGHTAMINFLGQMPSRERLLAIEGLAFHDYGKEPRPGRKLGHCTILRAKPAERDRALANALKWVSWS